MNRFLRILSTLAICPALSVYAAACGGGGDGDDDDTVRCLETFSFRPNSSANSVYLAGGWDGYDRISHKMSGPDATGTYSIELEVPSGEWGYYFLVDGVVTLDPEAPGTMIDEGQTYSKTEIVCDGVKTSSIKLSVQSGGITKTRDAGGGTFGAALSVESKGSLESLTAAASLRMPDGSKRALTSSELKLTENNSRVEVALSGLADGKYTVFIEAKNGSYTDDMVLPFWIEKEDFSFYDGPIYMVLIDRFRNGDRSNDLPISGSETPANFQGGDLWGVKQAIDDGYFDKLGVRSLWITPWQMQPSRHHDDYITDSLTVHVTGYHGYWPIRAREVEPRFGGAEALHAMVQAAHAHGIRIIMDTVLNHVHEDHEYVVSHPEWFRTSAVCKEINWSDPVGCMFTPYMPDIDWTNPTASNQFLSDVAWWVEEFDLDGLRVDAVKHMEDNVMGMLGTRMRSRFETAGTDFFMFGETFDGSVDLLNKYIGNGQLDGQFDFRRYFDGASNAFLNDGQGLSDVNRSTWDSINSFNGAMMVTFVGSHDVARVISRSDPDNVNLTGSTWGEEYLPKLSNNQLAYDRVWMAMFHLLTTPGVPLIYYGDEYGEHGGSDPDNRHFMKTEAQMSQQQQAQLDRMRKLGQARKALRAFHGGNFDTVWVNQEDWGTGSGNLWAYVRWDPKNDPHQNALMVMNLTTNTWKDVELHSRDANGIKLTDLGWNSGTVYDLITGTEYTVTDGSVKIDVPARGGVILGLK